LGGRSGKHTPTYTHTTKHTYVRALTRTAPPKGLEGLRRHGGGQGRAHLDRGDVRLHLWRRGGGAVAPVEPGLHALPLLHAAVWALGLCRSGGGGTWGRMWGACGVEGRGKAWGSKGRGRGGETGGDGGPPLACRGRLRAPSAAPPPRSFPLPMVPSRLALPPPALPPPPPPPPRPPAAPKQGGCATSTTACCTTSGTGGRGFCFFGGGGGGESWASRGRWEAATTPAPSPRP
jgi:hypothetical protein